MIGNIKISLKSSLVITLVIGLLLGTVFVFGMSYWSKTVTREGCVYITATYDSFNKTHQRQNNSEFILYFTDYEQVSIDSASVTDEFVEVIENIPENSKVIMLVHPNSNTVMDLIISGNKLIDYEVTMKQLKTERTYFVIFGCMLYLASVASGIKLITMRKKK